MDTATKICEVVDESGFVGCAQHSMDRKGRISFPIRSVSWNGAAYPRETGFIPLTAAKQHKQPRIYIFPAATLRHRMVSASLGLIRHPVMTPDKLGRILILQALRAVIGETREKLFIGVGPYCILTNDTPGLQAKIDDLLLSEETLNKLIGEKDTGNGAISKISRLVQGLLVDAQVDVGLDLDINGVRVSGNLTFSR